MTKEGQIDRYGKAGKGMDSSLTSGTRRVPPTRLGQFVEALLHQMGVPAEDARVTAHVLVEADLTGRHTHGVSRLPLYVDRLDKGLIASQPDLQWESPMNPAVVRLNGGNGLGPLVAWRATERVIELAERYGLATVAVHHSNHCGAMSVYCEEAARRGMILLALTNSPPGIPPWGGREAYFGTNPIAWGFPRGANLPPLVIDLATSVVARGNIIQAARLHQPIPPGWAIDKDGNPTTDAQDALEGAVLPMAGGKGYALALAVEVLSGVLSGAGVGPGVKNPYTDFSGPSNVGHFFLALNPVAVAPFDAFTQRLLAMEEEVREVPAVPGDRVRLPGDRGEYQRQRYLAEGIPLDDDLVEQLNRLAERWGVPVLQ